MLSHMFLRQLNSDESKDLKTTCRRQHCEQAMEIDKILLAHRCNHGQTACRFCCAFELLVWKCWSSAPNAMFFLTALSLGLLQCCRSEDREHPALPGPVLHAKGSLIARIFQISSIKWLKRWFWKSCRYSLSSTYSLVSSLQLFFLQANTACSQQQDIGTGHRLSARIMKRAVLGETKITWSGLDQRL